MASRSRCTSLRRMSSRISLAPLCKRPSLLSRSSIARGSPGQEFPGSRSLLRRPVDGITPRPVRRQFRARCRSSQAPTRNTVPSISFRQTHGRSLARRWCHQDRCRNRQRRHLPPHLQRLAPPRWPQHRRQCRPSTVHRRMAGHQPIRRRWLRLCLLPQINGRQQLPSRRQAPQRA